MPATASNDINITTAGLVNFNTPASFGGVSVTANDVLIGAASNNITSVAPSNTSGIPFVSNGVSADPSFTTMSVSGGGTGIISATAYAALSGGTTATGPFQSLTSGTSTQVLKSNGNAALPSYVKSNVVGSWQWLSSQSASASTNIDFTSLISATYTTYMVVFSNVVPSGSANLRLLVSTNNGGAYLATGYTGGYIAYQYNSTVITNNSSTTFVFLAPNYNAAHGAAGRIHLRNIGNGQQFLIDGYSVYGNTAGTSTFTAQIVANNTATIVNAIRFTLSTGTITTGTFTLYGVLE